MFSNFSLFAGFLSDLKACGSVCVPVRLVVAFVDYCNVYGVFPSGGCLIRTASNDFNQVLYI